MRSAKKDPGRPKLPVVKGSFGAFVREARERKKWTQPELAQRSGVKQSTVSRIERDVIQPDLGTRILIARALGTSLNDPELTEHVAKQSREVPVVGRVAAGKPIERIESDRAIMVSHELVNRDGPAMAFEVEGESMIEDHILDQDILICREVVPRSVGKNAVAVVEFDNDTATVKRWRTKGQTVTLGSDVYNVKQIRRVFEVLGLIRKMK